MAVYRSRLSKAKKTGRNRRTCDICGRTQSRVHDLERHKLIHLSPEERAKRAHHCEFPGCDYRDLQKSNVKQHFQRCHTGVKDKICTQIVISDRWPYNAVRCKFASAHSGSLTRHLSKMHGIESTECANSGRTSRPQQTSNAPATQLRRSTRGKQSSNDDVFTESVPRFIHYIPPTSVLGLSIDGSGNSGSSVSDRAGTLPSSGDFDTSRYGHPTPYSVSPGGTSWFDYSIPSLDSPGGSSSYTLDSELDPDLVVYPSDNGFLLPRVNVPYRQNSFDGYNSASSRYLLPELNLFNGINYGTQVPQFSMPSLTSLTACLAPSQDYYPSTSTGISGAFSTGYTLPNNAVGPVPGFTLLDNTAGPFPGYMNFNLDF